MLILLGKLQRMILHLHLFLHDRLDLLELVHVLRLEGGLEFQLEQVQVVIHLLIQVLGDHFLLQLFFQRDFFLLFAENHVNDLGGPLVFGHQLSFGLFSRVKVS